MIYSSKQRLLWSTSYPKMKFDSYTGGIVATNSYLLQKENCTVLVDAPAEVFDWLTEQEITPDYLLLTHQHFDHVEDAHRFDCPILAFSEFSRELILDERARASGLPISVPDFVVTTRLEGEKHLSLGPFTFELRHLPGHSPDSLVYILADEKLALVGDTLFQGGYGRTDLPGGDEILLFQGIREKLLTLPTHYELFPGHGSSTSSDEGRRIFK